jgi:hypothetical protein
MFSVGFNGYLKDLNFENCRDEKYKTEQMKFDKCYRRKFYCEKYGYFNILYEDRKKNEFLGLKCVIDKPTILSQIDDRYSTIDNVIIIPIEEEKEKTRNKYFKIIFIRTTTDRQFTIPLSDFLWMIIFNKLISINNECETLVTFMYVVPSHIFQFFIPNINDIKYLNFLFEKIYIHIICVDNDHLHHTSENKKFLNYYNSTFHFSTSSHSSSSFSSLSLSSPSPCAASPICSLSNSNLSSLSLREIYSFCEYPQFCEIGRINWGNLKIEVEKDSVCLCGDNDEEAKADSNFGMKKNITDEKVIDGDEVDANMKSVDNNNLGTKFNFLKNSFYEIWVNSSSYCKKINKNKISSHTETESLSFSLIVKFSKIFSISEICKIIISMFLEVDRIEDIVDSKENNVVEKNNNSKDSKFVIKLFFKFVEQYELAVKSFNELSRCLNLLIEFDNENKPQDERNTNLNTIITFSGIY